MPNLSRLLCQIGRYSQFTGPKFDNFNKWKIHFRRHIPPIFYINPLKTSPKRSHRAGKAQKDHRPTPHASPRAPAHVAFSIGCVKTGRFTPQQQKRVKATQPPTNKRFRPTVLCLKFHTPPALPFRENIFCFILRFFSKNLLTNQFSFAIML